MQRLLEIMQGRLNHLLGLRASLRLRKSLLLRIVKDHKRGSFEVWLSCQFSHQIVTAALSLWSRNWGGRFHRLWCCWSDWLDSVTLRCDNSAITSVIIDVRASITSTDLRFHACGNIAALSHTLVIKLDTTTNRVGAWVTFSPIQCTLIANYLVTLANLFINGIITAVAFLQETHLLNAVT